MPWLIIVTLYLGQFHRSVLLHFSTAADFQIWNNTLFSSELIPKLYPFIFLHKPIFGTVLLHLSFFSLFLFPFPANCFRNVLLQFLPQLFPSCFHRTVMLHLSTLLLFPYFPLDCWYSFTLLWYSFNIQLPYLLFSLLLLNGTMYGSNWCVSSSSLIQQTWLW